MASTSVSPPNCINGRYYYTTADQYIRPKYNTQYTSHCKLREASIYLVSSSFFSSLSFSFYHTRLERELLLFIFSLLLFLLLLLHLPHSPSLFSLFIPFPVNSPWERPETGLQSRRFRSIEIPVDLFFQPAAPVLLPKLCLATLASTSLFCSTFVSSNGELSIPLKSYRRCHFPSSDLWPRRLRFPPSPSQLLPVRRDDRTGWNISFRAFSSLVSSLVFVFGVHDFGCVCSWKVRNFTFFFFCLPLSQPCSTTSIVCAGNTWEVHSVCPMTLQRSNSIPGSSLKTQCSASSQLLPQATLVSAVHRHNLFLNWEPQDGWTCR